MQQEMIEGFRLSPQQKRLWLLQQEAQNQPYRSQSVVRIEGNLNIERLKVALQQVIDRHEILRTNFQCLPGMTLPLQVITDGSLPSIGQQDLSHLIPSEQVARTHAIYQEMGQLPFNLEQGPMLHLALLILSPTSHLLLLSLPALCADSVALKNLISDVSRCYAGSVVTDFSPEPMQYADFSEWQNDLLEAEETKGGREYWQRQDLSILHNWQLPFDSQQLDHQGFNPESIPIELVPQILGEIKTITQAYDVPISTFLLACWCILLWRLTGQFNLIVATACSGRQYEELKTSLGLNAKFLPICCRLEANWQMVDVLEHLSGLIQEQDEWQDYFTWEDIDFNVDITDIPFFSTSFDFAEWPTEYNNKDLLFINEKQFSCIDKFRIKLSCIQTKNYLNIELFYDSDVLQIEEVRGWAGYFQTLLENIIRKPSTAINQLEILTPADRKQLLFKLNNKVSGVLNNQCIHHVFEGQAQRTPDKIAVVFEAQTLTYAQLDARANQLARYLRDLGVRPDRLVGVCLGRSLEMIIAILGVLKAGGGYVPLEPTLPPERLAFLLQDSQASLLLTHSQWRSQLPEQGPQVVFLDIDGDIIGQNRRDRDRSEATSANLAYAIYTSGSTGKPKGVAIEHRQLFNYLNGILERLEPPAAASWALVSTFAADLGHTMVFPALCTGGCLHVISEERASNPDALAAYFLSHGGIDCLKIVPSHLQVLLACGQNPAQILPRHHLILGGEPSRWSLVQKLQVLAPDCMIFNHYGPTEATVGVLTYQVEAGQRDIYSMTVPLGQPLTNTQIILLDSQQQPVPVGVPGELYIGGAGLARGYLNRSELTAEKFIAYPLVCPDLETSTKIRLYRTGDLARYRPDGNIEFLGRLDEQIKIRGFRIELGEIESALCRHPAVQETVVITQDGNAEEQRLVAYVILNQSPALTFSEFRRYLQKQLPDYMIPSAFVALDTWPLMPNGKLDRQALPALIDLPTQGEAAFIAPRTPTEHLLTQIWSDVLGIEQVGIQDNFFELGGDSILSIQIVARANQVGLHLQPMQLFQHQTIAELVAIAEQTSSISSEQGVVIGPVPLTPIQHWFFQQNLSEPHHWNLSVLLEIPPTLTSTELETILNSLLEHHDALRLQFELGETGWQQLNASPNQRLTLAQIDCSSLPASEQTQTIEAEAKRLQATLKLSHAPLIQVALFDLGVNRPRRLLLVCHHLVMDGLSLRIFLEDFQQAYQQVSRDAAIRLPRKSTSFQHWSQQLTAYAQSAALAQELEYWLAHSQHSISPLPRDESHQPNTVASAGVISVSLSSEETQTLLQQIPAVYHTQINDLLLTALGLTLHQWTKTNTLLIELEGHGREALFDDVDLSRTIGWFTTRFPVFLNLDGISNSCNAIAPALFTIKEQLRQIPNRGIGYGILRYLSKDANIGSQLQALPQPEISFNYLGQFDQMFPTSTPMRLAQESRGNERSLTGKRSHVLTIDGFILDQQLYLHWTYSENVHRRTTIEAVAQTFIHTLRAIIHHGISPDGRYTPSDFPLVQLESHQIEQLSTQFALEDIYTLSPLQQGMVFHHLQAPESRLYCQQKVVTLQGNLDVVALQTAWQQVVNRHPSLRTIFIWEGLDEPLQVVLKRVQIPWVVQDWSQVSSEEQEQRLSAYLKADLQQGFALSNPPLMRLVLIQVAPEIYHLLWSHHHLLLDGWCNSIIFKEVFSFYEASCQGKSLQLKPSPPYRDYITWLQQLDLTQAERFWRQALRGVRAPTQLVDLGKSNRLSHTEQGYAQEHIQLSTEVTSALRAFARQHHLTPNTLFTGAWTLLLSRYSGEEDVVFGMTVSGRPAELPGSETMVGLLINTLPMRGKVISDLPLLAWLQQLQAQQAELLRYQYSPLVQVQGWSEVPRGMPLFESFVTFENYPIDQSLREQSGSLKILKVRSFFETNYPLSVTVEPGSTLLIRIDYTPSRFDTNTIRRILTQVQTVLENIPGSSDQLLGNIYVMAGVDRQQLINSFNTDLE